MFIYDFDFSDEVQWKFKKLFYGMLLAFFHVAILFFLYNGILGDQPASLFLGILGIIVTIFVFAIFRIICEGFLALSKISEKLDRISENL